MVATLVGVTVTLSFKIGPGGSGILAVFPIMLISMMLILQPRVGGPPTAAVMANAIPGLVGFGFAASMLHFATEPFGRGRFDPGAGGLGRLELPGRRRAPAWLCGVNA